MRVCGSQVGGHVACGGVGDGADVVRVCEGWGVSGRGGGVSGLVAWVCLIRIGLGPTS